MVKLEQLYPVFKGVVIVFDSNKTIKRRTIVATKGDLTKKNTYLIQLIPVLYIIVGLFHEPHSILRWVLSLMALAFIIFLVKTYYKDEERLDEVNLEDPSFASKFNVYSSDQVEARYLVTTAFMERFMNIKTSFGAKKAKCSFYGNKIMFAISTNKNLFELGSMFRTLEKPESINAFYNELSSIFAMISYFKLDEKTHL